ncbi:uncharacterized protein [Cardiocondyla obscurior]
MQILKCNAARRDNEALACPNFQSEWNERLKGRHRRIDRKGSEKIGLLNESLSNRKSDEDEFREKLTKTLARYRWYTIESAAEIQLQSRIESDAVRNIWNPEKFREVQRHYRQHQKQICPQNQQSRVPRQTQPVIQHHPQLYCALQYQPLLLRTEYQRKSPFSPTPPPPPILSPEVPEFFPKTNLSPITCSLNNDKDRRTCQIRYFPSLNSQSELFPFNRPYQDVAATAFPSSRMSALPATEANVFYSPQEWMQRVVPPMQLQLATSSSSPLTVCTPLQPIHDPAITHRPLQVYEKFLPCTQLSSTTPIPVYQRPIEFYQEPMLKRKSHGVDFNNLILLTKNSIKTRRGSSKPTVHQPFSLDSRQSLKTSGHNVQVQWLNKDHCSKKTKEIMTVNTLVSELRSFEEKYECKRADGNWKTTVESPQGQQTSTETSFRLKDKTFGNESSRGRSRRKLFENEKSRCKTSNAEQKDRKAKRPLYRDVLTNISNDAVPDVFEKRYDELEQQAMEQYKSSEESLALKYQELERQAIEQYGNSNVGEDKRSMNQDCLNGQKCSKYGHCSPSKEHLKKKGSYLPQITLLKPKGKSLPNVCCGSSSNDNYQTAITSKSLSALTDGPSNKSKNIYRGASEDKIATGVSVRASSKRRLILMSPFERKSEAKRIMKTTELRGICSFTKTKRNVFGCCRTSEIAQIGSGDENLAIIKSPSTEGNNVNYSRICESQIFLIVTLIKTHVEISHILFSVWLSGFWTT